MLQCDLWTKPCIVVQAAWKYCFKEVQIYVHWWLYITHHLILNYSPFKMFEKISWRNFQHLKELPTISCMMLKVFYLDGKLHFLCSSVLHLGNRSHVLVHSVWSMIVLPEIISVQNCFWNRSRKTAERQWIKLSLLGSSCQFRGQGMSVRLHTFLLCLMLLYWILKWWILLRGTLFLLQTILNWIKWKLNLIVVAMWSCLHTIAQLLFSASTIWCLIIFIQSGLNSLWRLIVNKGWNGMIRCVFAACVPSAAYKIWRKYTENITEHKHKIFTRV